MDYHHLYERLIHKALKRGSVEGVYSETHHIIPRSLGGSNDFTNLVELTYREHFLAHWVLTKMFSGIEKQKMTFAFHAMSLQKGDRKILSWQFDTVKRHLKDQQLDTRKRRERFKLLLRENKAISEARDLINKEIDGTLTGSEYIRLAALKKKHKKPIRVINRRHVHDRIAVLFIGREV